MLSTGAYSFENVTLKNGMPKYYTVQICAYHHTKFIEYKINKKLPHSQYGKIGIMDAGFHVPPLSIVIFSVHMLLGPVIICQRF